MIPVAMHLLAHRRRNADAARLGQRLQPRRNVDTIPGDVASIYDDVAEIDANAKFDALFGCQRQVFCAHRPL
jgi:hypothetical protein